MEGQYPQFVWRIDRPKDALRLLCDAFGLSSYGESITTLSKSLINMESMKKEKE